MRFYLDRNTHAYVLQCDTCERTRRITGPQSNLIQDAKREGWEEIGTKFVCAACALTHKRRVYEGMWE